MQIQCECGKFKAEIHHFPKSTLGRCVCYCDDCQSFLHHLNRGDLLDANGGTELIPTYPRDIKIQSGIEVLKCLRLSPNGLFRWYASCCKTPIGNTIPTLPWFGFISRVFTIQDTNLPERYLGAVKTRIMGRFAQGTPPDGTSLKTGLKDFMVVVPFILKGFIQRKTKNSPFFKNGRTPIVETEILSK